MYRIEIEKPARKRLAKIPKKFQYKIIEAIESLSYDPFLGKKLEGEFEGKYSLRVWPYRVIYRIFKKEIFILILDIGHRQGIY